MHFYYTDADMKDFEESGEEDARWLMKEVMRLKAIDEALLSEEDARFLRSREVSA